MTSFSLPYLIKIRGGESFGTRLAIAKANGELLTEPEFASLGSFELHGQIVAPAPAKRSGEKYGYIGPGGDWIVPPDFDEARSFAEDGLARFCQNGKWGYVGLQGDIVIEPRFAKADAFRHGLAAASIDGKKVGFIDTRGQWVIEPRFKHVLSFDAQGMAQMCKAEKWGYIDRAGNEAIACQFEHTTDFCREGIAVVRTAQRKYGAIDKTGTFVLKPDYEYLEAFSDAGLAVAGKTWYDRNTLINLKGAALTGSHTRMDRRFSNGLLRAGHGRWGFYDSKGGLAIPFEYEYAGYFEASGVTAARRQRRWGVLYADGRFAAVEAEEAEGFHQFAEGFNGSGLCSFARRDGSVIYVDCDAQTRFILTATGDADLCLSNAAGHVLWTSAPALRPAYARPVLAHNYSPERDLHDTAWLQADALIDLAERLLAAEPRRFKLESMHAAGHGDPYEIDAYDDDEDEDERTVGAVQVLASHYVGEEMWGEVETLMDEVGSDFQEWESTFRNALESRFGPCRQSDFRYAVCSADNCKVFLWPFGERVLCLESSMGTGDGDFWYNLVLNVQPHQTED